MTKAPTAWLRPFASANSVTTAAWWITLPGAAVTTLTLIPGDTGTATMSWLSLGVIAHVMSGILLLFGELILRANPAWRRPYFTLGGYVVVGAIRGGFLGLTSYALGWSDGSYLEVRIPAAAVSFAFWFSVATVLVDGTRRHRAMTDEIRVGMDTQQHILDQSAQWLSSFRSDALAETRRVVTEQLQRAVKLSADPALAAGHLRTVVDDVVRPLSRSLTEREVRDSELQLSVERLNSRAQIPLRLYVNGLFSETAVRPVSAPALTVATCAILTVHLFGATTAVLALVVAGVVLDLALRVASRRIAGHLRASSLVVRIVTVLVVWIAAAELFSATMVMIVQRNDGWIVQQRVAGEAAPIASFVAIALVAFFSQVAVAVHAALETLRAHATTRLREVANAVEWASARLRQQAWAERRQLGRILHGDAQSRIVSLALQLQLNPPADAAAAIEALAADISQTLDGRDDETWVGALAQLHALWSGAIELSCEVDADAQLRLEQDATAAQAVSSLLREAVTNAVRHGGADMVTASVTLAGESLVVMVTDDGSGWNSNAVRGLGNALFDAVSLEWSVNVSDGTRLTARIPCAAFASSRSESMVTHG